jgi:hypothetical protein
MPSRGLKPVLCCVANVRPKGHTLHNRYPRNQHPRPPHKGLTPMDLKPSPKGDQAHRGQPKQMRWPTKQHPEVVATDGPPLRFQICFLFNKAQKTIETSRPKRFYLRVQDRQYNRPEKPCSQRAQPSFPQWATSAPSPTPGAVATGVRSKC